MKQEVVIVALNPTSFEKTDLSHKHILVVEADASLRARMAGGLRAEGFEVETSTDGPGSRQNAQAHFPDFIVADLPTSVMRGAQSMHQALSVEAAFGAAFIVGYRSTFELAKRFGYRQALAIAAKNVPVHSTFVGESLPMLQLYHAIATAAPTRVPVLITGESGSGKELVARAMHEASSRSNKPYVIVNCATLVEGLLESELFGHERGAFTGAFRRRNGRFVEADGGTLFLDEVAEIPPSMQVKLLRVLQDQTFERVGSGSPIHTDVRLLAATNCNLQEEMRMGRFRKDLYYRLQVVELSLAPLRDRGMDVSLLTHHFLEKYNAFHQKCAEGFAPGAARALMAHNWPGNVRELENAIEHAVIFAQGNLIEAGDLPSSVLGLEAHA
jgi:DNA-binding NtrC family response regulator